MIAFLTDDEVQFTTGKRRPAAQSRFLKARRIRHWLNGSRVVVPRSAVEQGGQERRQIEPNFAAVEGVSVSDKIRVYISGPYTKGDPVINTRNAIAAADEILRYGHVPIVPHLTMFWHFMSPKPWEDWIAYDLELIEHCGILLRLPGESVGADKEVAHAKSLGKLLAYSIADAKAGIDVLYWRGTY